MCVHMLDIPLYHLTPTIGSIAAYGDSRLGPMACQLKGGGRSGKTGMITKRETFIQKHNDRRRRDFAASCGHQ